MFCRSLFVRLYFFFWPLCCLFFFDLWILITPLVSTNSSCTDFFHLIYFQRFYIMRSYGVPLLISLILTRGKIRVDFCSVLVSILELQFIGMSHQSPYNIWNWYRPTSVIFFSNIIWIILIFQSYVDKSVQLFIPKLRSSCLFHSKVTIILNCLFQSYDHLEIVYSKITIIWS
jgi:hypothetical protein